MHFAVARLALLNIAVVQSLRMQLLRWLETSSGMMNFGPSGIPCWYKPKLLKHPQPQELWLCSGYARYVRGFPWYHCRESYSSGDILSDVCWLFMQFPFFCSDREYIIGRRIWETGRTYYCVTKVRTYDAYYVCQMKCWLSLSEAHSRLELLMITCNHASITIRSSFPIHKRGSLPLLCLALALWWEGVRHSACGCNWWSRVWIVCKEFSESKSSTRS